MSDQRPFGHDTLVIPFRGTLAPRRPGGAGMSRMRSLGELYRGGVVNAPGASEFADIAGSNPVAMSDLVFRGRRPDIGLIHLSSVRAHIRLPRSTMIHAASN